MSESIAQNVHTSPISGLSSIAQCRSFFADESSGVFPSNCSCSRIGRQESLPLYGVCQESCRHSNVDNRLKGVTAHATGGNLWNRGPHSRTRKSRKDVDVLCMSGRARLSADFETPALRRHLRGVLGRTSVPFRDGGRAARGVWGVEFVWSAGYACNGTTGFACIRTV